MERKMVEVMFSELIKNFDKSREYMRDFYIYGFKVRDDFTEKSGRTYDDERRRIESWLGNYVKWGYSGKGKRVFLSLDSARIPQNPLFAAWKSKTFTKTDIMLHFYLLELLGGSDKGAVACGDLEEWRKKALPVEQLTDEISLRYGQTFDVQTVRNKLREYEALGIMTSERRGRAYWYFLSDILLSQVECKEELLRALQLFQEIAPFGFIGSTILDGARRKNELFQFKHHFIVHTLEDGILEVVLSAMEQHAGVRLENRSRRSGNLIIAEGVPLKIMVSVRSGRRYICIYEKRQRRFACLRLDSILRAEIGEEEPEFIALRNSLEQNLPNCWGVSFGKEDRRCDLMMRLAVDEEKEGYILERLLREGKCGKLDKLGEGDFSFQVSLFDGDEASPWIKTFMGRILELRCTDKRVEDKFRRDTARMYEMYCTKDCGGETFEDGTVH